MSATRHPEPGWGCQQLVEAIRTRDPRGVRAGIPADCSERALVEAFGLAFEGEGSHVIGTRPGRRCRTRMLRAAGFDEPLRASLDEADGRVALLDVEYPELVVSPAEVLAGMGEPQTRLDFSWDTLMLERAEWVWPARGVALQVNPETDVWLRWMVFSPTSLDGYQADSRLVLGTREW